MSHEVLPISENRVSSGNKEGSLLHVRWLCQAGSGANNFTRLAKDTSLGAVISPLCPSSRPSFTESLQGQPWKTPLISWMGKLSP